MLTIYRRHLRTCPQTSVTYRRCKCPIHVRGSVNGEKVKRRALDLTNWEKAQEKTRLWEIQGSTALTTKDRLRSNDKPPLKGESDSGSDGPGLISIDESVKRFFAHLDNCDLSPATIKKNRVVIQKQLADFCLDRGFIYLSRLGINELDDFIGTWKDSPISKVKKMERLKSFFRFCSSRKLNFDDPSVALRKPKVIDSPTLPFSSDQM